MGGGRRAPPRAHLREEAAEAVAGDVLHVELERQVQLGHRHGGRAVGVVVVVQGAAVQEDEGIDAAARGPGPVEGQLAVLDLDHADDVLRRGSGALASGERDPGAEGRGAARQARGLSNRLQRPPVGRRREQETAGLHLKTCTATQKGLQWHGPLEAG